MKSHALGARFTNDKDYLQMSLEGHFFSSSDSAVHIMHKAEVGPFLIAQFKVFMITLVEMATT
jgi:hypothetical protein